MSSSEKLIRALKRPAAAEPEGALVLFHGRGANEYDLYPLLDVLDPEQRLLGLTPRAPLSVPPGAEGAHWYVVKRVGFPDEASFAAGYGAASAWLDALPFPPERIVLAGFSQGAVMSFALGLGKGRPRPAAIIGLSGFIPVVDGWEPDLSLPLPPVAIGHGIYDPVIPVTFGRSAKEQIEAAGGTVLYRESPIDHTIDPAFLAELGPWMFSQLDAAGP